MSLGLDRREGHVGESLPDGTGRVALTARRAWSAIALALVLTPGVVVAVTWATGTVPSALPGLPDPGPLTTWGLRVAQSLRDLMAALTVGLLVLAALCAPGRSVRTAGSVDGARAVLLVPVAVAAAGWSAASLALLAFSWSDAIGWPVLTPGAWAQIAFFGTEFELGRALLVSSALAAVVALGAVWVRSTTAVGALALVAVVALWPLATIGHAAGDLNHDVGVNSLFGHLVGITVWTGGLVGLGLLARRAPESLPTAARHFSPLAGASLVLVTASGLTAALLRLESWSELASSYGAVLAAKVVLVGLLAVAGAWHRRRLLDHLEAGRPRAFVRLAAGEVVVLCVALGLGVVLSRTDPPGAAAAVLTTPQALLGFDLPPALDAAAWFSAWRVDTLFAPIALVALWVYLRQVRRLRRRGDRWPLGRTLAWVGGWCLLVWATSGAPGVYGRVLFSMHMVQHMTIATAVPALLVLAAPVTLALRAVPGRKDGSRGPREWLMVLVHFRALRVLAHPLVAAPAFVGSLVVFYSTGLFELSLRSHTAHVVMVIHFLVTGYLFAFGLIGIDPGVSRPAFPYRVLILMVTFGAHAFYSVSLMASTTVLAEDWFGSLGRTWGASLERDQYTGASIGWALGDYPLLIIGVALIVQWFRHDQREQRQVDRRADRDGGAALASYNAYLTALASRTDPPSRQEPD